MQRSTNTNESGLFTFPDSTPANDTLKIAAQGLNKYGAHSATSHDGLHPNAATHQRLAEAVPLH